MRDCKPSAGGPHQPVGVFILTTGVEVGWHSFRRVISLQGTKRGLLSHVDDKHPGTAIHNEKRGEGIKVPTQRFVIAQETWGNSHVSKVKEDKLWNRAKVLQHLASRSGCQMSAPFPPFVQPLIVPTLLLQCLLNLGECPSQPELFPIFSVTDGFRRRDWWCVFQQSFD